MLYEKLKKIEKSPEHFDDLLASFRTEFPCIAELSNLESSTLNFDIGTYQKTNYGRVQAKAYPN